METPLSVIQTGWWVMMHPNPAVIAQLLQRESERQPLTYFIPFIFIQHRPDGKRYPQDQAIRAALHRYIFIRTGADRIQRIVEADWNRSGVTHLIHVRTKSGHPLIVGDDEMQSFLSTLKDSQLQYYVGQPTGTIQAGDRVIIQREPWTGRRGTVTEVLSRGGRVRFTISMELLGDLVRLNFTDLGEGDVIFEDPRKARLITGNLLKNFEEEVLRVLGTPSENVRLTRLYAYRSIHIDEVSDARRFTALMLVCAHLLQAPAQDCMHYRMLVEGWLNGIASPRTADEAYFMLALFVVTRNPDLRDAVKAYRNTHPDCPEVIRRMFSKVKKLRVR